MSSSCWPCVASANVFRLCVRTLMHAALNASGVTGEMCTVR